MTWGYGTEVGAEPRTWGYACVGFSCSILNSGIVFAA